MSKKLDVKKRLTFSSLADEPRRMGLHRLRIDLEKAAEISAPPSFHFDLQQTLAEYPSLSMAGWERKETPEFAKEFADRVDEVYQLCIWATRNLRMGPEIDEHHSSYQIKHLCEAHRGIYTSQGELIAAAIILGYTFEIHGSAIYLNIARDAIRKLEKEIFDIGEATPFLSAKAFREAMDKNPEGKRIKRKETWIDHVPYHEKNKI